MAARQKKSGPGGDAAGSAAGTPGPTRQIEIETKLELDPDAPLPALGGRKRLTAVGVVGPDEPVTHHLDAVYYDTENLDLLRSRVTLRRRTGGPDAGWHLKLPAVEGARTEVGLPLSAGDGDVVPDGIGALVLGAARGRPLAPVARVLNERTVRHLLDAEGTVLVEVADDHVTGIGLIDGRRGTRRWREVEAELVKGTGEQLAATVEVLTAGGARPASSPSKLARALDYRTVATRRGKTAGDVIVACIARQTDRLITADRAAREGGIGAALDARPICRRIAGILTVYAPLFDDPSVPGLRDSLRGVVAAFDTARDIQSARQRLVEQLAEEPAPYRERARTRLEQACDRRMATATTRARVMLNGPEYLAMLRSLDDLVGAPPLAKRAQRAAGRELAALLSAGWHRLQELAESALADPARTSPLQEVGDWATTMRYAAESTVGPLGPDAAVLAAALEELQESVEEHLDAQRAADLLAALAIEGDTDGVAGFIFGRLHAVEQNLAHAAVDDFTDAWDRIEDGELVAALGQ
jgi:inorganic triphosphatase YgiF